MSRPSTAMTRTPVQLTATVVGAVFLVVGIAGFIPGLTTDYDTMQFAGHESQAMLLGVFAVSILHNIVHLAFGVVGLVMARTAANAFLFLVGGGVVYLVLWLYGLVIDHDSGANFVPVNNADNWLHLVLALGMIAVGFALGRSARTAAR
jgi:arginine exporter protein ArgO